MNLFKALFLVAVASVSAFAGPVSSGLMSYASASSTSGGLTITANVAYSSSMKPVIYSIAARSDLSTSVVQIQEANASGSTTNYTTIGRWDVGAATTVRQNGYSPVFVGKKNYGYRFLLDSTTANNIIVIYQYE